MRVTTGSAKGITLKALEGMDTRPTLDKIKQVIFNAIQFDIEGKAVLDLFAGSGQMGIEALSRGAKSCVFVDQSTAAIQIIKENLKATRLDDKAEVISRDCKKYVSGLPQNKNINIIFIDPPYGKGLVDDILVVLTAGDALSDDCIIVAESRIEDIVSNQFGSYTCVKEYRHGIVKVGIYKKEV